MEIPTDTHLTISIPKTTPLHMISHISGRVISIRKGIAFHHIAILNPEFLGGSLVHCRESCIRTPERFGINNNLRVPKNLLVEKPYHRSRTPLDAVSNMANLELNPQAIDPDHTTYKLPSL